MALYVRRFLLYFVMLIMQLESTWLAVSKMSEDSKK